MVGNKLRDFPSSASDPFTENDVHAQCQYFVMHCGLNIFMTTSGLLKQSHKVHKV